eukprot:6515_1
MQKQDTQDRNQVTYNYFNSQSIQINHYSAPIAMKDHCGDPSSKQNKVLDNAHNSFLMHFVPIPIRYIQKSHMITKFLMNVPVTRFCQAFAAGFTFQTVMSLITAIFSRKISWHKIKKIYSSKDSLLFASVCGLISFTFNAIVSILKQYTRKDSLWHKTFAGFICGIWILLDNKHRRNKLALYCIIRSLSDLIRVSIHYKKIPNIKHANIIAFSASQMIIMYATFKDPKNLDRKYYKWIMKMGDLREKSVQNTIRSPSGAMYRLEHEPFIKCHPIYHNNRSCLSFNIQQWFSTLIRASTMYFPVHFLPTMLFKPKSLVRGGWFYGPINFIKIKVGNTLVSSMFLATYVFNAKYTMCVIRNVICDDPAYVSICGGLMSGLSLLIENPKRRSELMLYCIPKAVEFFINRIIDRRKYVMLCELLQTNVLPTIVFQIALAVWLTIYSVPNGIENSNFINMKILQIIFGKKAKQSKDNVRERERIRDGCDEEMDRNK